MTTPPPPIEKTVKPKRGCLKPLALSLVAVLILLFLFRGSLLRGPVLKAGIWAAQRYVGLEVRAARLETNGWSFLRVEGLEAEPLADDNPLRRITAESVDARFSLPDLLRGRIGGLTSLQARGLDVEVDLTVTAPDPDAPPSNPLPDHLPALTIEGLRFVLIPSAERKILVSGGNVSVEPVAGSENILLDLTHMEIEAPETRPNAFPVRGKLVYQGGLITVDSFEAGTVQLSQDSFVDLTTLADDRISARLEARSPSGDFSAEGSLDHGVVDTRLNLDSLELASLTGILSNPSFRELAGSLDLQSRVIVPLDAPFSGSGQLEADLDAPRLAGRRFDRASIEAAWDGGVLVVDELVIDQGANHVELTARNLPLEEIEAKGWLERAEGTLKVQMEDLPALLAAEGIELPEQMPVEVPAHRLSLEGRLGGGSLEIQDGALTVADGRLQIRSGRLGVVSRKDASGTDSLALDLDLDLWTDFPDLTSVGAILGAPGAWSGSLRGEVQVTGVLPELSGQGKLEGERLVANGVRLGRFQLDASAEESQIRVRTFQAEAAWGTLGAVGGISLADRRLEGVEIEAEVQDAALFATEAADLPDVVGSFCMTARLAGSLDQLQGQVELSGAGGLAEGPIFDTIALNGQAADGLWQLQQLIAEGDLGRFEAAGQLRTKRGKNPLDGATGEITQLQWQRDGEELALQQPASFELNGALLEARNLELRGSVGGITADLRTESGETTLRAVLEDVEPSALVGALLPEGMALGGLSGTVNLASGRAGLVVETEGHLDRLESAKLGDVLSLDWRARLEEDHLWLDELAARRGSEEILTISGEAPLAPLGSQLLPSGAVRFEGTIRPFLLDNLALGSQDALLSAQLDGDFTLGGEWEALEGDVRLRGRDMSLDLSGAPEVLRGGEAKAQLHLGTRGDGLRLESLTMSFPDRLTAEASGSVPWDGDVTTLVTNAEALLSAPLDLQAALRMEDVRWLRPLLPEVRRFEGTAWADLHIQGTVASPLPTGTLHLEGIALRLEEGGFSLEDLAGRIDIQGRRLDLAEVTGKLGAEPFELGGTVDLAEGGTGFDVSLSGKNLLLLRDPNLRLRSDVDVRVTGPLEALVLRGSLGLRNSRLTQEIDLLGIAAGSVTGTLAGTAPPTVDTGGLQLFSFPDPPLSAMRLDLAVTTVEPLAIDSNLANGTLRMDLRLSGTGEVPLPQGLIYLEPTKLRLPSGTVQLDSGTIRFREENPFSPSLALNGSARLRGYDVELGVTGTLNEPEVLLTSTPPLANDELLLLVLTGQLPATGGSSGLADKQAAEAVVLYLARDFLTRWLSKGGDPEDASWVNRFEIVRGRDVSENGVETTEASFRILGEDDLSGDLRTLYLVAEQDSFEDYNYGLRFVFRFQ